MMLFSADPIIVACSSVVIAAIVRFVTLFLLPEYISAWMSTAEAFLLFLVFG
jgi:hypothetical protein